MRSDFGRAGLRAPTAPNRKRRLLPLVLAACAVAALGGCRMPAANKIHMTPIGDERTSLRQLHWTVDRAIFLADARGQYQLLAVRNEKGFPQPTRHWLYVRLLWDISPTRTGTDPTALNAHIGYLLESNPAQPDSAGLYYEGMGNVYVEKPNWFGARRFVIRRSQLKLARPAPPDGQPAEQIELEGNLSAGADPDIGEVIQQMMGLAARLRFPATAPAATAPATSQDDD